MTHDFESLRPFVTVPGWKEEPNLVHGFGTDFCGYEGLGAENEDDRERAKRETVRRAAQEALLQAGEAFRGVWTVKQTHSTDLLVLRRNVLPAPDEISCDGIVTDHPGLLVAVKTADCLPLLFYAPQAPAVAAVHAGWRGVFDGIAVEAIRRLQGTFGVDPARLQLAIGPGAGACCYEVSDDLARRFEERFGPVCVRKVKGRMHLDLVQAVEKQVVSQGMKAANVHKIGHCTICRREPSYYSWRRDREKTGRLLHFIGIREAGG